MPLNNNSRSPRLQASSSHLRESRSPRSQQSSSETRDPKSPQLHNERCHSQSDSEKIPPRTLNSFGAQSMDSLASASIPSLSKIDSLASASIPALSKLDDSPSGSAGGDYSHQRVLSSPEGAQTVSAITGQKSPGILRNVTQMSSVGASNSGGNFQTEFIRNLIREELEDMRDQMHTELSQLFIEILRLQTAQTVSQMTHVHV